MRIVTDVNNVITAILYAAHIDGSIEIKGDIPENIEPMKWCYTPERGFYENPYYTPPIIPDEPVITTEQRLTAAENAIEEIINIIMEG